MVNSKNRPQTPVVWDLSTEFPLPGQRNTVEYPSSSKVNLKKLGEPLDQQHLVFTPLQAKLVIGCWNYADWDIGTQWQIENKYGYELTPSIHFAIFDKEGRIWKLENQSRFPPFSVAPGFTKVNYASGEVSAVGLKCYDNKRWSDQMPPPPRDLKMLVWSEKPLTTEARQQLQTPVVWGVYNLGDIPIAPPL